MRKCKSETKEKVKEENFRLNFMMETPDFVVFRYVIEFF